MVTARASVLIGLAVGLLLASLFQWAFEKRPDAQTHLRSATDVSVEAAQLRGRRRSQRLQYRRRHRRDDDDRQGAASPRHSWATTEAAEEEHQQAAPAIASPHTRVMWQPRACPFNCSGYGVCNQDSGVCLCEMGRDGVGCERDDPFPCNLPHGEQLVARCSGACDLHTSKCSCGGGKFPARSMHKCVFADVGRYTSWDGPGWDYESVAKGPEAFWSRADDAPGYLKRHPVWTALSSGTYSGPYPQSKPPPRTPRLVPWCDAEPDLINRGEQRVAVSCRCEEGSSGRLCEAVQLHSCLNQCNGRGACRYGYCACDAGWYGADCSLNEGRIALVQPLAAADQSSVAPLISQPATPASLLGGACDRAPGTPYPAVYVYELPLEFNLRLWTAKSKDEDCALRSYSSRNITDWKQHAFGMEVAVYEQLLHSPHRVSDPARADFFYVPVWGGCWLSRFSRPTPRQHDLPSMARQDPLVRVPRAVRASELYRRAYEYIRTSYPFWNHSGGADHIWTFPHDEGACLAPKELSPSILVSHWGRLLRKPHNHTSTSTGQGWHVGSQVARMYGADRCFSPGKDVLLPIFKSRNFVQCSPFVTGKHVRRNVLLNFRGNAHLNQPAYSFGLRQQLYTLLNGRSDQCKCADPGHLKNTHSSAMCAAGGDMDGCLLVGGHSRDYIADLQRSVFCAVLPGNGWGHIEEPAIHGCIPVIVMPGIHVQLEGVLNMSRFTVRVERRDLPRIVEVLRGIPPDRIAAMQAELARVWERFTYSGIFKREMQLQERPPTQGVRARVGAPPQQSDQKSHVFRKLEPRLRGLDATDALLAHLRHKLAMRPGSGCKTTPATMPDAIRVVSQDASAQGHGQLNDENGALVPADYPSVPLIDHGPHVPPLPAVPFFVWTSGVV